MAEKGTKKTAKKKAAKKTASKKVSAKKAATKKTAAKKTASKKSAGKKTASEKTVSKKAAAAKTTKKKSSPKSTASAAGGKLRVTQIGSTIGTIGKHRDTIRGLGLKRLHHTVELEDTPAVRGMIRKVAYLVRVEEA